jgi:hypothetical protein
MMTLRFRQQNRVDGDGSWWRFLWPFFVVMIRPFYRELRENAIFVIFSVPLLRKATKNRFRELSIFVSPVHFYVNSTEFEKSIERSI